VAQALSVNIPTVHTVNVLMDSDISPLPGEVWT
jgi:hypothetical protein